MRKLLSLLLLSAFVASICFAPAMAADKPKADPAKAFARMDKDKDGKVTKDEFLAGRQGDAAAKAEKAFSRLDKNGDGSLSLEEFKARGGKKKN